MPGRLALAALAAVVLLSVAPASAQIADSDGEGLARASTAHAVAEPFALPLRGPNESPFGSRWGRLHAGLDLGVLGTDRVHAALARTVAKVGYQRSYGGYGNVVLIQHGDGLQTLYAHLASYGVKPGQRVGRGELIGRAGCTGSCTGQHLHFEVRNHGKPVNPMRFLARTLRR